MKYLAILALVSAFFSPASLALTEQHSITELAPNDQRYLQYQRQRINDLFMSQLGQNIRGDKSDLIAMQKLIDQHIIKRDDTLMNQALGVVFGDLLAKDLNMKWVVYTDQIGRSRALQLGHSEYLLFPVSIISRRTDAGITPDIQQLYRQTVERIQPHITKNPYYKPVH
ncbi:hypothetical protein SIN8267_00576 [Sinobacterium norvegicum]|uniref:DUF3806 domain-containing protein n=1 Tax=Sinobacterium norvegicum TaxID=1641715 RepID=A0ABM9ABD3_9GAMM|nr:DUF3806 domain-containing protein [Sinobacterium norvegicum]CAH0990484.1 hypothetical protein SIN8267_00576 [Sinobacterium norvegicum]